MLMIMNEYEKELNRLRVQRHRAKKCSDELACRLVEVYSEKFKVLADTEEKREALRAVLSQTIYLTRETTMEKYRND